MMNSIIFCEGRVDAHLIGQYLSASSGWNYSKKPKPNLQINKEDDYQEIKVYERNNDWIYIWAVGGRTRFSSPIQAIKGLNEKLEGVLGFNNIIILVDNDDGDEGLIRMEFDTLFNKIGLTHNEWAEFAYKDGFGQDTTSKILLMIIPFEEAGALETIMIRSLSVDDDENLVPQCCDFIENLKTKLKTKKFLQKRRDILKAKLSTIVSIVAPDRAVDTLLKLVEGIRWEQYGPINQAFKKLLDL